MMGSSWLDKEKTLMIKTHAVEDGIEFRFYRFNKEQPDSTESTQFTMRDGTHRWSVEIFKFTTDDRTAFRIGLDLLRDYSVNSFGVGE